MSMHAPESLRSAERLRDKAVEMFGGDDSGSMFFAPGTLVSLRLILAGLSAAKQIAIANHDYFDQLHLLDCTMQRLSVQAFIDEITSPLEREKFSATLNSTVTYMGVVLPSEVQQAESTLLALDLPRPLVLRDHNHAGAIGFPALSGVQADLVFGDLDKWLSPGEPPTCLTYVWAGTELGKRLATRTFHGFFLAAKFITELEGLRHARWISTADVETTLRRIERFDSGRAALLEKYRRDRELTCRLATAIGLPIPASNILWIPDAIGIDGEAKLLLNSLSERNLVWKLCDGTRVLCQA